MANEMKERIEELENIITNAQDAYYNGEDTVMSDQEFDTLWNELEELDPNNKILHRVGADSGSAFDKAEHVMHCHSQEKATEPNQFRKWANKYPKGTGFLVEYKCDGSSIELQYINGKFDKAVSRGNGEVGDVVTSNIKKAKGVIHKLKDSTFTGAVRGEVLLFHEDFKLYFKDKANCRNAANGIMKRKDSLDAVHLSVVTYDAFRSIGDNFSTEMGKLLWLKENGFNVVDVKEFTNIEDIIKYRDELSISRFSTIPYDIDGLVIKCPEVDIEDSLRDRPTKQIAFKFILNEQPTIVRSIEWSINGRTRTPVAICDPVFLCGTTVKRATLANIGIIKDLGLKIGSTVMMVKRGEIIPHIERVVMTPDNSTGVTFPTTCEFCGSKLVISDTQLYCPNKECRNMNIHRLRKWSRVNKIYGLGDSFCEKLYDTGTVKTVKDLYTVSEEKIGLAIGSYKNAEKIYKILHSNMKIDIRQFIAGYDLVDIGEEVVKNICKEMKIKNLEEFLNIRECDLEKCNGFSQISSRSICEQLREYKSELLELAKILEVTVTMPVVKTISDGTGCPWLYGQSVAITGDLKTMKRSEAIKHLESVGGIFSNKVTKNTKFLVANEPSSHSKYTDAVKFGTTIVDEEEFIKLLKGCY